MFDTIYVITLLNVFLTIFNIIFHFKIKKSNKKEVSEYVQSRNFHKQNKLQKPQFKARAPSNSELYDRERNGEKIH